MAKDGSSSNKIANPAAQANWDSYQRDLDAGHAAWVDDAVGYDNFYVGEQWKEADRQKLESEGKPVLTINLVLSTINTMLGEQINNQAEIVFKPTKGSSSETASTLTNIARHIQKDQNLQWKETQVFADGLILDRGFFDMRIDFSRDIRGEISIEVEDPFTILLDCDAKDYDPKTWNRVTKTKWFSLDEIELNYGKKARQELEDHFSMNGASYGSRSVEIAENSFGEDNEGYTGSDPLQSHQIRRTRVIERQHKKLGFQSFYVDNETGDKAPISDEAVKSGVAEQIAQATNCSIVRELTSRIAWTVSCDNYLIWDGWSPYNRFTIIPFFPYFRRGKPFGAVRNLISPQEQLNKAESQELHIINTTANSGWVVEAGSLVNMTDDELEEKGAETGLVLVYRAGKTPPQKIQPNQIPTGISNVGAKSAQSIKNISGVSDAMLGSSTGEVSGVRLDNEVGRGMTQLQVPFNNLKYTQHLLAEHMLELIQQFYTETRIYYIEDREDPKMEQMPVQINQPMSNGLMLNDVTVGEYDVTISSAPVRDTAHDVQFAQAIELRNAGVYIPDDVVIENSNLYRKHEIAERVRQIQGFGEPTPEEQQMQQMQLQMAIQTAQAELAEKQARAQMLAAQAQQFMAKAESLGPAARAEIEKIIGDLQLAANDQALAMERHYSNLQNKLDLANLHASSKQDLTRYTTTAKRTAEEFNRRYDLAREALRLSKTGDKPAR